MKKSKGQPSPPTGGPKGVRAGVGGGGERERGRITPPDLIYMEFSAQTNKSRIFFVSFQVLAVGGGCFAVEGQSVRLDNCQPAFNCECKGVKLLRGKFNRWHLQPRPFQCR